MKNFLIYLIVIVGGAAVLAIELLGTRILGPFYGVSIFLWSALISITLIALSAGYYIGGKLADRSASIARLCALIAIAGIWIDAIPWLKYPVLSSTEQFGLRWAVLCASFVLFFPPLALLGMISPYAIKLKTKDLSEVGRSAGNLYAISTLASVIAALATGFYLIPHFGIFRLTLATGSLLILTSLLGFVLHKKIAAASTATLLIVAASFLFINSSFEQTDPTKGLIAIEQSPYAELRVLDLEDSRYLLIDGSIHTIVDTAAWRSYFHYVAVMDIPKYFFNKPGSMLLIGIGGGSLVKQYAKDDWKVDAVDIDPKVIKLARTHFNLYPSEGNVIEMDGRKYLSSTKNYYDVILLDAFGSSEIPFHLVTKEVFSLIASRLNNDGIFALNVEAIGWDDPIVKTLIATMKQSFTDVVALPQEEPPTKLGNIILLASTKKLVPLREPERNDQLDPDWRYSPAYQRVHAWDNRFTTDTTGVQILTDDLNPIDIRAEQISLATRVDLHQYFQKTGVSW